MIHVNVLMCAGAAKPAIFLEGGIHAREWISPATVTFIIRELVTNPAHAELLHMFDWIIVPIVNPDGYEYSHTKVSPLQPLCCLLFMARKELNGC